MSPREPLRDARFEPSAERGHRLDATMRARLAQSLSHVFDAIGAELGIGADAGTRIASGIVARRQSPQLFGTYYDLVLAVERDEIDKARLLAAEIEERLNSVPPKCWAASLESRPAADQDRYQRLLLPEDIPASEPSLHDLQSALERIAQAMALLERGFPEMAAEIRALLFEVVIAAGPTERGTITFDGSSSYMLWGAIMLNATGQANVLDTAQALAHESGHNLLFGFCANGSLIDNDDEEAFAHPLRQDPRPMDGVVHAAYVTARMHQTLERLLESGALDEEQRVAAEKDLQLHRLNFAAADDVIRADGLLTDVGKEAIEAARAQLAVHA